MSRELGKRGGRVKGGKVWQIDAVWPRARTETRKGQWGSALFERFQSPFSSAERRRVSEG